MDPPCNSGTESEEDIDYNVHSCYGDDRRSVELESEFESEESTTSEEEEEEEGEGEEEESDDSQVIAPGLRPAAAAEEDKSEDEAAIIHDKINELLSRSKANASVSAAVGKPKSRDVPFEEHRDENIFHEIVIEDSSTASPHAFVDPNSAISSSAGRERAAKEGAVCSSTVGEVSSSGGRTGSSPDSSVKNFVQLRLVFPPVRADNYRKNSDTGKLFLDPSKIGEVRVQSLCKEVVLSSVDVASSSSDVEPRDTPSPATGEYDDLRCSDGSEVESGVPNGERCKPLERILKSPKLLFENKVDISKIETDILNVRNRLNTRPAFGEDVDTKKIPEKNSLRGSEKILGAGSSDFRVETDGRNLESGVSEQGESSDAGIVEIINSINAQKSDPVSSMTLPPLPSASELLQECGIETVEPESPLELAATQEEAADEVCTPDAVSSRTQNVDDENIPVIAFQEMKSVDIDSSSSDSPEVTGVFPDGPAKSALLRPGYPSRNAVDGSSREKDATGNCSKEKVDLQYLYATVGKLINSKRNEMRWKSTETGKDRDGRSRKKWPNGEASDRPSIVVSSDSEGTGSYEDRTLRRRKHEGRTGEVRDTAKTTNKICDIRNDTRPSGSSRLNFDSFNLEEFLRLSTGRERAAGRSGFCQDRTGRASQERTKSGTLGNGDIVRSDDVLVLAAIQELYRESHEGKSVEFNKLDKVDSTSSLEKMLDSFVKGKAEELGVKGEALALVPNIVNTGSKTPVPPHIATKEFTVLSLGDELEFPTDVMHTYEKRDFDSIGHGRRGSFDRGSVFESGCYLVDPRKRIKMLTEKEPVKKEEIESFGTKRTDVPLEKDHYAKRGQSGEDEKRFGALSLNDEVQIICEVVRNASTEEVNKLKSSRSEQEPIKKRFVQDEMPSVTVKMKLSTAEEFLSKELIKDSLPISVFPTGWRTEGENGRTCSRSDKNSLNRQPKEESGKKESVNESPSISPVKDLRLDGSTTSKSPSVNGIDEEEEEESEEDSSTEYGESEEETSSDDDSDIEVLDVILLPQKAAATASDGNSSSISSPSCSKMSGGSSVIEIFPNEEPLPGTKGKEIGAVEGKPGSPESTCTEVSTLESTEKSNLERGLQRNLPSRTKSKPEEGSKTVGKKNCERGLPVDTGPASEEGSGKPSGKSQFETNPERDIPVVTESKPEEEKREKVENSTETYLIRNLLAGTKSTPEGARTTVEKKNCTIDTERDLIVHAQSKSEERRKIVEKNNSETDSNRHGLIDTKSTSDKAEMIKVKKKNCTIDPERDVPVHAQLNSVEGRLTTVEKNSAETDSEKDRSVDTSEGTRTIVLRKNCAIDLLVHTQSNSKGGKKITEKNNLITDSKRLVSINTTSEEARRTEVEKQNCVADSERELFVHTQSTSEGGGKTAVEKKNCTVHLGRDFLVHTKSYSEKRKKSIDKNNSETDSNRCPPAKSTSEERTTVEKKNCAVRDLFVHTESNSEEGRKTIDNSEIDRKRDVSSDAKSSSEDRRTTVEKKNCAVRDLFVHTDSNSEEGRKTIDNSEIDRKRDVSSDAKSSSEDRRTTVEKNCTVNSERDLFVHTESNSEEGRKTIKNNSEIDRTRDVSTDAKSSSEDRRTAVEKICAVDLERDLFVQTESNSEEGRKTIENNSEIDQKRDVSSDAKSTSEERRTTAEKKNCETDFFVLARSNSEEGRKTIEKNNLETDCKRQAETKLTFEEARTAVKKKNCVVDSETDLFVHTLSNSEEGRKNIENNSEIDQKRDVSSDTESTSEEGRTTVKKNCAIDSFVHSKSNSEEGRKTIEKKNLETDSKRLVSIDTKSTSEEVRTTVVEKKNCVVDSERDLIVQSKLNSEEGRKTVEKNNSETDSERNVPVDTESRYREERRKLEKNKSKIDSERDLPISKPQDVNRIDSALSEETPEVEEVARSSPPRPDSVQISFVESIGLMPSSSYREIKSSVSNESVVLTADGSENKISENESLVSLKFKEKSFSDKSVVSLSGNSGTQTPGATQIPLISLSTEVADVTLAEIKKEIESEGEEKNGEKCGRKRKAGEKSLNKEKARRKGTVTVITLTEDSDREKRSTESGGSNGSERGSRRSGQGTVSSKSSLQPPGRSSGGGLPEELGRLLETKWWAATTRAQVKAPPKKCVGRESTVPVRVNTAILNADNLRRVMAENSVNTVWVPQWLAGKTRRFRKDRYVKVTLRRPSEDFGPVTPHPRSPRLIRVSSPQDLLPPFVTGTDGDVFQRVAETSGMRETVWEEIQQKAVSSTEDQVPKRKRGRPPKKKRIRMPSPVAEEYPGGGARSSYESLYRVPAFDYPEEVSPFDCSELDPQTMESLIDRRTKERRPTEVVRKGEAPRLSEIQSQTPWYEETGGEPWLQDDSPGNPGVQEKDDGKLSALMYVLSKRKDVFLQAEEELSRRMRDFGAVEASDSGEAEWAVSGDYEFFGSEERLRREAALDLDEAVLRRSRAVPPVPVLPHDFRGFRNESCDCLRALDSRYRWCSRDCLKERIDKLFLLKRIIESGELEMVRSAIGPPSVAEEIPEHVVHLSPSRVCTVDSSPCHPLAVPLNILIPSEVSTNQKVTYCWSEHHPDRVVDATGIVLKLKRPKQCPSSSKSLPVKRRRRVSRQIFEKLSRSEVFSIVIEDRAVEENEDTEKDPNSTRTQDPNIEFTKQTVSDGASGEPSASSSSQDQNMTEKPQTVQVEKPQTVQVTSVPPPSVDFRELKRKSFDDKDSGLLPLKKRR